MHILIDTNVVLDVLLDRPLFVDDAAAILSIPESIVYKYISASAITDIYYVAYKELRNKQKVKDIIKRLLSLIHIADVSEENILFALESDWNDFEDSVQNAVAESHNFDAIITRNSTDFKNSNLKILSPKDFLNAISKDLKNEE
ncbi:PIN domain-containing protein [Treponema sp. OMZ 305]|uniref:PIN domain-containing protein n=1 Tax=Treponema sp. OMZ 305 TaxID=1659192 RepID=UPI0020A26C6E|nr:PIN domain-containing protein [Treponema sp. OMZ 305]UTC56815.1 PIN domain-containing protein [Treponema sp. OMZ 305]